MINLNAIWREVLASDPLLRQRPHFRFDPEFYLTSDPGLRGDLKSLRSHFRNYGKSEGRFPTRFRQLAAIHPEIVNRVRELVTDVRILEGFESDSFESAELAFELMRVGQDSCISNFSAEYYLRANPDVARSRTDPLEHFLLHGVREGRSSLRELRSNQFRGEQDFDPSRPTCLIALHELSNTGAPHVGLDLAIEATATHNVVVAALRPGELLKRFIPVSCDVVITSEPFADFDYFVGEAVGNIDVAICNSVESFPFIKLLVARDIPFAAYVHEYASYTFPTFKSVHTALFADVLAFTSEHVRDSWRPILADVEFDIANHSLVLPQRPVLEGAITAKEVEEARARLGALIGRNCNEERIICGAGHVQWRKGTDIFAMAAQIARQRDPNTIFVWVGDGLNPEDIHFGAWLNHHLTEIGAGDPSGNLFLLPAGEHYRDVLRAADAMLLTSRLDPLPNVVFDALAADCEVVLFEGASGFTDPSYQRSARIHMVEYANPEAAASKLLTLPRRDHVDASDVEIVDPPTNVFQSLIDEVDLRVKERVRFVLGPTKFDVPVLFSGDDNESFLRTREREKLFTVGRRFLWRDAGEAAEVLASSENWIHRSSAVIPYEYMGARQAPPYGVHIHAYYPRDLSEMLDRHAAISCARSLVITTDTVEKSVTVEATLRDRNLSGEVRVVQNRGRDVLPFLDLFRPGGIGRKERVWGHFHLKRSVGSTDGGELWRDFMTAILLGDEREVSTAVQRAMNRGVGLVAPLDPHVGQWNASRGLLPRFEAALPDEFPQNPLVYPMGNMFWVKKEVAESMLSFFPPDFAWPNEPLPNDGTVFHLIERLWPVMAAKLGLRSLFVVKEDQPRRA